MNAIGETLILQFEIAKIKLEKKDIVLLKQRYKFYI